MLAAHSRARLLPASAASPAIIWPHLMRPPAMPYPGVQTTRRLLRHRPISAHCWSEIRRSISALGKVSTLSIVLRVIVCHPGIPLILEVTSSRWLPTPQHSLLVVGI